MDRRPLGTVSAPSGKLAIFDMGYASVWENGVEAPQVFSDHGPVDVPESIDYAIVGDDAAEAARRFDRQPGVWLYDIPLEGAERYEAMFAESVQGLDARLEREPSRVGYLERSERAAGGAGAFWMGGLEVVVVGGLDTEREYCLSIDYAEWGPEVGYRPSEVTIEIDPAAEVAASEELGVVMVDWARLMVVDPAVMSHWRHEKTSDGLCDVAFWGRDGAEAAAAVGAGSLPDDVYGWPDLPLETLPPEVERLQAWRVANPDKIIRTDVRPHSHHWEILTKAAESDGGGTITLGDALVTGFFTEWGDGAFPVFADRAADGALVGVRIVLGDESRADRMRQVAARQRATLHHHQPIDTNFDSHIHVLLPGTDEDRWEGLPARRVGDGYEITCAPLMAYDLSYGDVVDWRSDTDWTLVRRSGHRTIRIGTEDKEAFDQNRHTLDESLQQLRHEWLGEYYVAIDIPPGAAAAPLERFADVVPGTLFEYTDQPPDWVTDGKGSAQA